MTDESGKLWLITSALFDNDTDSVPTNGRRIRDAVMERGKGVLHYRFPYATVRFEEHTYDTVADAIATISEFESAPAGIEGKPSAFEWISLRPAGGPEPNEAVARILLAEESDGTVGKTEHDAIFERFLDFGEHSVAVAHPGISIAGEVADGQVEVYLYFVAQIAAAIARYSENEKKLSDVMIDIRERAAGFDVEALQQINISTSKAMLDISDELLDIPPRESFILRTLLEVANVDVYEQRISRMLGIVQHHVTHRHAVVARRNSQRIEFVLFIIAAITAVGALNEMYDVAARHLGGAETGASMAAGIGMIFVAIIVTVICSVVFYRVRKDRSADA